MPNWPCTGLRRSWGKTARACHQGRGDRRSSGGQIAHPTTVFQARKAGNLPTISKEPPSLGRTTADSSPAWPGAYCASLPGTRDPHHPSTFLLLVRRGWGMVAVRRVGNLPTTPRSGPLQSQHRNQNDQPPHVHRSNPPKFRATSPPTEGKGWGHDQRNPMTISASPKASHMCDPDHPGTWSPKTHSKRKHC